ncbi:SDR family oxidoreductase [Virgibacillus pantothenticus]|uniref:SDR family oxidoreductase n=1 Tax=Virgibacillus pantothenticus TaxID=1473 RepID=UPI001C24C47D|nr:SDR family oxidoreductase [Virgibacillus pantothenticus]MBU8567175.1 SDR family oxidoreductase [Virgibacillus pantothenticus]MBU8600793.1 SDR family oxidoreductase [Virgibacillus pantothenticus]MBU8635327.1 SDR family oxidoreductase [Virgibacillus pantothenticus]MBU8643027.1 SDR family oxidoreductase [Virgibacillus pantothenticus]MBU8646953.1 SDR family oxidoreductase [Virgibacillus pantothenticus]
MNQNWLDLDGKVAIVTGGASGIGFQIVNELLNNGAKVVVADLHGEEGEQENQSYFIPCDVSNKKMVIDTVGKTVELFGKVDILINNAGVNLPRLLVDDRKEKPEYELTEDDFDLMVGVNQKGTYLFSQAAAKQMLKQKKGVIINVASEAGQEGSAGQSCYSATKGAVISFTRAWAKELGKFNIRVVGLAPGVIEATGLRTDAYNEALAYTRNVKVNELSTDYSKSIPLGREGKLTEIAHLAAFLASDKSSYITGTTVNISGGKSRG